MRRAPAGLAKWASLLVLMLLTSPARAQQYNSDNYLSKPHGMATIILTTGERNSMLMNTFSLIPRWEFTAAAYLFYADNDPTTGEGYSTSLYFKYMIHENKAQTGGLAVKAGTGLDPGYVNNSVPLKDAFRTYWTNAPLTLPLFDNKLSWDIMPGASVTKAFANQSDQSWAFTYATRLAYYPTTPISPTWCIAGEIYGAEGEAVAIPEYRIGLRWEPNQHVVYALTYDQELHGSRGAGVELGVMFFTPPFAKLGK